MPESFAGKTIWLQPDGVNYRAEIWVNGNLLSTLNGMFISDYINVTDFVKVGRKNILAVKVYPVDVQVLRCRKVGELPENSITEAMEILA